MTTTLEDRPCHRPANTFCDTKKTKQRTGKKGHAIEGESQARANVVKKLAKFRCSTFRVDLFDNGKENPQQNKASLTASFSAP